MISEQDIAVQINKYSFEWNNYRSFFVFYSRPSNRVGELLFITSTL